MTQLHMVETGSYTGNGTSQTITLPWDAVMVITISTLSSGSPGNRAVCFHISGMTDGSALECSNAAVYNSADCITLGASQFSVGSDDEVNDDGTTFYWIAFRDCERVRFGTYTGDGSDPQAVFTLPTDSNQKHYPIWTVVLQTTGTERLAMNFTQSGGTEDWETDFQNGMNVGQAQDLITNTGLGAADPGLEVSETCNTSGETYWYFTLDGGRGHSDQNVMRGGYTGDGSSHSEDNGRALKWLVLMAWGFDVARFAFKTADMPAGDFGELSSNYNFQTTGIDFDATGFTASDADYIDDANIQRYVEGYTL